MANEQNKSNKGPMNGFGQSEIEKIGQTAYSIPKSELEQRARATTARTQMEALSDLPEDVILKSKALTRVAQTAPNTLMSAESRIRSSVESRLERSNMQAANVIGREYSETAINSQARSMYERPEFQNKALSMMNQSYDALGARRQEIAGQISNLGQQSAEAAGSLFTNRGVRKDLANQIAGNANQADTLTKELASIDLAMKIRRQTGTDPLSRFEKLNQTGKSAEDFLTAKDIGEQVRSGSVNISKGGQSVAVDNADIGKAIANEAEALRKALSDLANSAGKSSEELEKMRGAAEESAENFEKLQKAAAAGGGGNGATGAQWASAAGGMFNAVGQGIQQIAVGQRLGQVGNIAGYAGIENQKYDMYKSGRGGNVLSQMLSSSWSDAEGFGKQLKTGQQAAVAAYTAGGVAQTAAGGFQVVEGLKDKGTGLIGGSLAGTSGIATQEVLQGAQNVVQGASVTAVNGMDLYRGVSTNAAAIQGTQADMAARRELLKVSAEQLQGFRDYGVGMSTAAQGMGKRAGAFIDETTGPAHLEKMVNSRLSPEQMSAMSQQGVAAMGSQFQTGQIFAARGLERSGMGSMAENMQRMTALAGAGANNPQAGLATVLESAFSKSLDSSKAISAMVDNTATMAMSSNARAAGLDVTGGAAAILAANINPNDKNQEYAVNRAMTAAQLTKDIATNTDVSFSGMVNTSRISKSTGLSGTSSILAAQLSPEELSTLKGLGSKEAGEFLFKKGIDVKDTIQKDPTKVVQQLIANQTMTVLEGRGKGLGLMDADTRESIANKIGRGESFEKLSRKEQKSLNEVANFSGYASGEEMFRSAGATSAKGATPQNKTAAAAAMAGEGGSDSLKTWDNLRTSGFKQLSEQALQATKTMEKFGGALKVLVDMNDKLEKFGSSGGEAKFSTAAADAAASFGASTTKFSDAVGIFDSAIRETMTRSGLNSKEDPRAAAETAKLVKQGQKAMDSKAGSR